MKNAFIVIFSAQAPVTMTGTMSANIIWKDANTEGGRFAALARQPSAPSPRGTSQKKRKGHGSPMKPLPLRSGAKARLKPMNHHMRLPTAMPAMHCIIIEREFLRRIMPACAMPMAGVCSITSVVPNIMSAVSAPLGPMNSVVVPPTVVSECTQGVLYAEDGLFPIVGGEGVGTEPFCGD